MAAATARVWGSNRSRLEEVVTIGLAFLMPPSSIAHRRLVRNGLHHMWERPSCRKSPTSRSLERRQPIDERLHQIDEDHSAATIQVDAIAVQAPAVQARHLIGGFAQCEGAKCVPIQGEKSKAREGAAW